MNRLLVSNDNETIKTMLSVKNKNIVFIIDECHRSQFGDMNSNIKKMFKKIRYIGFTGTPIFVANKETKLITNDIFHKNLHKYLMPNAIEDGNVLAFQVFYNNETQKLDDRELSKLLKSSNYLENAAKDIIEKFDRRSINRKYSAMVVLEGINSLIKFYKLIKDMQEVLKQKDPNWKLLKIGATFSYKEDYSKENSLQ